MTAGAVMITKHHPAVRLLVLKARLCHVYELVIIRFLLAEM